MADEWRQKKNESERLGLEFLFFAFAVSGSVWRQLVDPLNLLRRVRCNAYAIPQAKQLIRTQKKLLTAIKW